MTEKCITLKQIDTIEEHAIRSYSSQQTLILRICMRLSCVLQTYENDDMAKLEPIQYPKQTRKLVPINVPSCYKRSTTNFILTKLFLSLIHI